MLNINPTAPFLIVRDRTTRPPWWKRLWQRITGRKLWSPFDADGRLDEECLKREGWHFMGSVSGDE